MIYIASDHILLFRRSAETVRKRNRAFSCFCFINAFNPLLQKNLAEKSEITNNPQPITNYHQSLLI
jgi:hypothetical protein